MPNRRSFVKRAAAVTGGAVAARLAVPTVLAAESPAGFKRADPGFDARSMQGADAQAVFDAAFNTGASYVNFHDMNVRLDLASTVQTRGLGFAFDQAGNEDTGFFVDTEHIQFQGPFLNITGSPQIIRACVRAIVPDPSDLQPVITTQAVVFDAVSNARIQRIRTSGFKGTGIALNNVHDCDFESIHVESCGSTLHHAFEMIGGNGGCVRNAIHYLAVELSNGRAIGMHPDCDSNTVDLIHSERLHDADPTVYNWLIQGSNSTFRSVGLNLLSGVGTAFISGGATVGNTTFEALWIQEGITASWGAPSGSVVRFVAPDILIGGEAQGNLGTFILKGGRVPTRFNWGHTSAYGTVNY